MKRIILAVILVFALSFSGKSQQIDTTFKGGITVCKIVPVLAQFNDKDSSNYLGINVISDNLKNSATLYWQLLVGDSVLRQPTTQGNYTIQGEDYQKWCNPVLNPDYSCDVWPFYLVGKAYNLTFALPNIPPSTGSISSKPGKN